MDPVVHFEIPFSSGKRAKEFYKKTFGWKFNDMPEMNYAIAMTTEMTKKGMPKKPGQINGGMMKKDKMTPYPVLVIEVKSVTAAVNKAKKNGARLVAPRMEVGDMGYYARVKDTEGNIIGIWENK